MISRRLYYNFQDVEVLWFSQYKTKRFLLFFNMDTVSNSDLIMHNYKYFNVCNTLTPGSYGYVGNVVYVGFYESVTRINPRVSSSGKCQINFGLTLILAS